MSSRSRVIGKVHAQLVSSVPSFCSQLPCMRALLTMSRLCVLNYQKAQQFVLSALSVRMGLPVEEPEGAFYAFPSIMNLLLNSEAFCERAIKEFVNTGTIFLSGAAEDAQILPSVMPRFRDRI